ncbi:hypothetical protein BGZ74_000290 [Mortierella antarctica]|nr:hypothetical protein BGZ74_000290 [Mortierella antarctica]
MKFTTVVLAALAIAGVVQSAAIPNNVEAAPPYPAPTKKPCGCMRWCKPGPFVLCCDFVPCS